MRKAVDIPTENLLYNCEGRVSFAQFLNGVYIRARGVVDIVGVEHSVNVIKKVASCGLVLCRVPLLQENEVVNIDVDIAEAEPPDGV